jgi:hypothetical protein
MHPRTATPCIARDTRIRNGFLLALLLGACSSSCQATSSEPARFHKADLGERFLLQVNYSEAYSGLQNFMTSRSRIVRFEREGAALHMLDDSGESRQVLATIPIRGETERTLDLDLNAAFDEIDTEEDRTGEDYYGRIDKHDGEVFRLVDREMVSVSYHEQVLVFDQKARKDNGDRLVVHYYLSRYRPDPDFRAFEMKGLDHFGFYETYPQQRSGRWVLYAMKFDAHEPIVFALSATIPERYRDAVRDGVLYWNRALGTPLLRVVDAPPDVRAPSPDYNVIEWVTSGDYTSTSYIQSDPLTGQILHAHVFVLRETMMDGDLEHQNNHLRYIVAHEIGHALGLRHNFAPGRVTTVMDYFDLTQVLEIGRDIGAGEPALPYDREVIRHVYLGEPLDLTGLPAFCTDNQKGCSPFPSRPPREFLGIKGGSPAESRVPAD